MSERWCLRLDLRCNKSHVQETKQKGAVIELFPRRNGPEPTASGILHAHIQHAIILQVEQQRVQHHLEVQPVVQMSRI